MLKICIAGHVIHKVSPTCFRFEREHNYPYTVTIDINKGLMCNCKEFYKTKSCEHSTIVYNMLYMVDLDPASLLHQKYWELLNEKGLGKNTSEDFRIKLESLDEVTFEDEKVVIGKYFNRYSGRFILITINKSSLEV